MWTIITFAVCFMLACVMLISGNGNIGETKNAIEDTIIQKEIDAAIEERAINYYSLSDSALTTFDQEYIAAFDKAEYLRTVAALMAGGKSESEAKTAAASKYYGVAALKVNFAAEQKAVDLGYGDDKEKTQEIVGVSMFALNPELIEEGSKTLYNAYLGKTEDILDAYDVTSLVVYAMQDKGEEYITSIERRDYVSTRAEKAGANFLALNIVSEEAVDEMIKTLSS